MKNKTVSKQIIYVSPNAKIIVAKGDIINSKLKKIFKLPKKEAIALLSYLESEDNKRKDHYLYDLFKQYLPRYACDYDKSVNKFQLSMDLGVIK